jgi:hypothetical protein
MKRYRVLQGGKRDLDEREPGRILPNRLMLIDAVSQRFWILGEYPDSGRACDDIASTSQFSDISMEQMRSVAFFSPPMAGSPF